MLELEFANLPRVAVQCWKFFWGQTVILFGRIQKCENVNKMCRLFSVLHIPVCMSFRFLAENKSRPVAPTYHRLLVTDIKSQPHHVLIAYGTKYCSGSLTSSRIVVTSASCFLKRRNEEVLVKVGCSTVTEYGQVIPVIEIKYHEYYQHLCKLDNDIALLLLKNHVKFNENVKKTILIQSEVAIREGLPITILGWGSTNLDSIYMNKLIRSDMELMNKEECRSLYGNVITPSNFCIHYSLDSRMSDNGGGAMYDDLLVGILSAGVTNRSPPHVAIVTNVSYFHRWIKLNTKRFLKKYCVQREINQKYIFEPEE